VDRPSRVEGGWLTLDSARKRVENQSDAAESAGLDGF
jgi:hypothetical protein